MTEVAVIDFDGTLIDLDLGREFTSWLIRRDEIGLCHRLLTTPLGFVNQVGRKIISVPFSNRFLLGFSSDQLVSLADQFLSEMGQTIQINQPLVSHLQALRCRRLLLTGSPEFLVRKFLKQQDLPVFDEVIGQREGRFGWFGNPTPFGRMKPRFVSEPIGFAIGDSYNDRFLLRLAREPVVILSDRKLVRLATKNQWSKTLFGDSIPISESTN